MAESEWVTFYRNWHPGLGCYILTQKRDGCTRTVLEGSAAACQPEHLPAVGGRDEALLVGVGV